MNKRFILTTAGASAAAIGGAATADITVTFGSADLLGGEFVSQSMGSVSGSLTSISYVYEWANNTGDSSWSSDMVFGMSDGFWGVSIGGFNMGFSDMPGGSVSPGGWFTQGGIVGSPSSGVFSGSAGGFSFSMSNIGTALMGNGWDSSAGTTTEAIITFHGVNAIPAPGALALLGLAGIAGGSRRRK